MFLIGKLYRITFWDHNFTASLSDENNLLIGSSSVLKNGDIVMLLSEGVSMGGCYLLFIVLTLEGHRGKVLLKTSELTPATRD
jgi:hypothetical protein